MHVFTKIAILAKNTQNIRIFSISRRIIEIKRQTRACWKALAETRPTDCPNLAKTVLIYELYTKKSTKGAHI